MSQFKANAEQIRMAHTRMRGNCIELSLLTDISNAYT